MTNKTIKRHLKNLRKNCIEGTDDPILKEVAYAMETAVRRVTEKVVGWGSLEEEANRAAAAIAAKLLPVIR